MPANVDENLHVFEHMYMRVRANKCAYVTWYRMHDVCVC